MTTISIIISIVTLLVCSISLLIQYSLLTQEQESQLLTKFKLLMDRVRLVTKYIYSSSVRENARRKNYASKLIGTERKGFDKLKG